MSKILQLSIRILGLSFALLAYSYSHSQRPVITFPVTESFELSKFTDVQWIGVSAQGSNPQSIIFNEDGTRMILSGFGNSERIQISELSTSFDISTATYTGSDNDFIAEDFVQDMEFNPVGSKLFGVSGRSIYEYNLTENYDLSSAVFAGSEEILSLESQMSSLFGFEFNSDGTKAFALGREGSDYFIFEYSLSEAYDVSTAIYEGEAENFNITELNTPWDFSFNSDGTMMFVAELQGDALSQYSLASPFDVSSATYSGESEELQLEEAVWFSGRPNNFVFDQTGIRLYVLSGDRIFEYAYTHFVDFGENSTETVIDVQANDGIGGENDASVSYSLLGSDTAFFQINDTGEITFKSPPDFEVPNDLDSNNIYEIIVRAGNENDAIMLPIHIVVQDLANPVITKVGSTYNLALGEYTGDDQSFDISSEEVDPTVVEFNDDGTKMYVLGTFNQTVVSYNLTVPYDVSTAEYAGESQEFSVADQESFPTDLTFSSDGTRMFVVGSDGDAVVEYALSTSYDVSTAQYAGESEEFSVQTQDGGPTGIGFNQDGTKLFILGTGNDIIITYNLSTAFDVSSAVYAGESMEFSISEQLTDPRDFAFNEDGTKLFVSGLDTELIQTYNLSEAFNLSSVTYAGSNESLDFSGEEASFTSLTFDNLGSKVFVIGFEASVFEYTLTGNSSETILVPYKENQTEVVIDINANDGNGGETDQNVTYNLTGDDASIFQIDQNGSISFVESPNFESPQDVDGNNTYMISVIVSNGQDETRRQFLIDVLDENDSPIITNSDRYFDFSHMQLSHTLLAERDPFGISLSKTGQKMYVVGRLPSNASAVLEYDLKSPFDLSSAIPFDFDNSLNIQGIESAPTGVFINDTGDKLFVSGTRGNVNQYDLEIAFDVTTGSRNGFINIPSSEARGLAFSSDGLRVYSVGRFSNNISEVELSSPFNLSSTTDSRETFSVAAEVPGATALAFSADGKRLYVANGAERIARYDLNEAFNITTAQYSGLRISTDMIPIGMALNPEGSKMFITGSNDQSQRIIQEYIFPWRIEMDLNSSQPVVDIDATDGFGGEIDSNLTYSLSGVDSELLDINESSGVINFKTTPSFGAPEDENMDNIYEFSVLVANGNDLTEQLMLVSVYDSTPPSITSNTEISVDENITGVIYEITADEQARFALGNEKDESLFSLEGSMLSFLQTPDFESPVDSDGDNKYVLDLFAVDSAQNTTSIELIINVINLDEDAPVITSATSVDIEDGTVGSFYQATANEPVTFSLGELKDETHFSIVEDSLNIVAALFNDNPVDANLDNTYLIDLIATDTAGNQSVLELAIIVNPILGLSKLDSKLLYPNPAKEFFRIGDKIALQHTKRVKLFTLDGLEVKVFSPQHSKLFDISDLPVGLYIVYLEIDDFDNVYSILIKK